MNKQRVLIVALVVAVFLNLLLAGYIIGRESPTVAPTPLVDPSFGFPRLLRVLPEERVDELMSHIRDHRARMKTDYRHVVRAQRAMYGAIVSDPFDMNRLRTASTEYADIMDRTRRANDRLFLALVEQLTPEERQQIVESARSEWRRIERPDRARPEERSRESSE